MKKDAKTTMDTAGLVLFLLLPLRASSAATPHDTVTAETPGQFNNTWPYQNHPNQTQVHPTQRNQKQLLTREPMSIHGASEIPGLDARISTTDTPEGMPGTHVSMPTAPMTNISTPAAPTNSVGTAPTATTPISRTRNPTKPPTASPGTTGSTSLAPPSSQPTVPVPASTSSIRSQRTSAGPGARSTKTSGASKTTPAGRHPKPRPSPRSRQETQHGKVVAGVIGGALAVMILGFLLVYVKKRRLQKQQITSTDWAGPSPFLVGGANSDQVTLRSSNQILLSSFLPQRLSKRLSLLPEVAEEMQDMSPGGKPQGSTFGQGDDAKDGKDTNGSAAAPTMSLGGAEAAVDNSASKAT